MFLRLSVCSQGGIAPVQVFKYQPIPEIISLLLTSQSSIIYWLYLRQSHSQSTLFIQSDCDSDFLLQQMGCMRLNVHTCNCGNDTKSHLQSLCLNNHLMWPSHLAKRRLYLKKQLRVERIRMRLEDSRITETWRKVSINGMFIMHNNKWSKYNQQLIQ